MPLLFAYPLWISFEFVLAQLKRLFTCNRKYGTIETTSDEESPLSINDPDMHGSARNLEDVLHPEIKRTAADKGFLSYLKEQLYNNPNFSFTRYLLVSVMLAIFNLFSAWTWYECFFDQTRSLMHHFFRFVSLDLMPVAINGAIYRSTMVFVFILSILFLKEVIVFLKLVALALCVAGVVVVGIGNYQSDDSAKNEVLGYVLVLVSSFLYACYEVSIHTTTSRTTDHDDILQVGYRRWIGEANVHGILLINSMMGFVVLVGLWFLIPVFWATGVEPSVTFDYDIVLFLLANAGFVVSYYLLYTFGMTATSPLYMNTTGLVGMPMAAVADWLLKGKHFAPLTLGGMALVTLGVLAINIHVFCKKQYQRFAACMKERMWCMVSPGGIKPQLHPTSTM